MALSGQDARGRTSARPRESDPSASPGIASSGCADPKASAHRGVTIGFSGCMARWNEDGRRPRRRHPWESAEALALVRRRLATMPGSKRRRKPNVSTCCRYWSRRMERSRHSGATCAASGPNILIGGVDGLDERQWEGGELHIGGVIVEARFPARSLSDDGPSIRTHSSATRTSCETSAAGLADAWR